MCREVLHLRLVLPALLLALLVPAAARCAAAAERPPLAFTADTEGHARPCQSCPSDRGLGGLARRATLLNQLRAEHPGLLLVSAGNAFVGADSPDGQRLARAYEQLGYDAVNLTYHDLPAGPRSDVLRQAEALGLVSATLTDAAGKPLVLPYRVSGGVAFVGVSDAPAGLKYIPSVKVRYESMDFADPATAAAEAVAAAGREADHVVVLFHGSMRSLRAVHDAVAGKAEAILVGGLRPDEVPEEFADAHAILSHGRTVGLLASGEFQQIKVAPDLLPDPQMSELLSAEGPALTGGGSILPAATEDLEPQPLPAGALQPGDAQPVQVDSGLAGQGQGLRLAVTSAQVADDWQGQAAEAGHDWLVLEVTVENDIPLDAAFGGEREAGEAVLTALPQNLFLVGGRDGAVVWNPALGVKGEGVEGVLPDKFKLQSLGSAATGEVAFRVPEGLDGPLQLRLYHDEFPPAVVNLRGELPPDPADADAAQPNAYAALAVHEVEFPEQVDGKVPPEGTKWVIVDLRGQSRHAQSAPPDDEQATQRPKGGFGQALGGVARGGSDEAAPQPEGGAADASAGQRKPAIYLESLDHLQLLVDGQWARTREPAHGTLSAEPVFLPDRFTGGRAAFLVPADATSLELVAYFPLLGELYGPGTSLKPQELRFAIAGDPVEPEPEQALHVVKDDPLPIAVIATDRQKRIGSIEAGEASDLLVLDARIENASDEDGRYDPTTRFGLEGGKVVGAVGQAGAPLRVPLLLPAGERRAFKVVLEIPTESSGTAEVGYSGVKVAAALPLDLPKPAGAVAEANRTAGAIASTPEAMPESEQGEQEEPPELADADEPEPEGLPPDLKRVPARPDREPRGLAGVGLDPEQVNRAIDRGAEALWAFLLAEDLADGPASLGGKDEHVLCALALVHADYHEKNPEFDAAVRGFIERYVTDRSWPGGRNNYEVGLYCMLIEALQDPQYRSQLREAAQVLVERQLSDGSWTYGGSVPNESLEEPASTEVLEVVGGVPLDGTEVPPETLERVGEEAPKGSGDNSVTQFAILGLSAAARSGFEMPREIWLKTLGVMETRQSHRTGGWDYGGPTHTGYGSMTCAGVAAIALCGHHSGFEAPHDVDRVQAGLGWLDERFQIAKNPEREGSYAYYYIYSLERVGRILGTEFIGEHEWYPQGARYLVGAQRPDGLWIDPTMGGSERHETLTGSSFALLFLTRATPTLEDPNDPANLKRGGEGQLVMRAAAAPFRQLIIILDASGSMLAELEGERKFDVAREAVLQLIEDVPEGVPVGLVVYGHRLRATDPKADEDVEVLIPPAPLDRAKFTATLRGLRARGKTPLALSLDAAAKVVTRGGDNGTTTVVLLTDGGQGREPGDPIASAANLASGGSSLQIVGFDIEGARQGQAWGEQLRAMADAAGGRYLPAGDAVTLTPALRSAVLRAPNHFELLEAGGNKVTEGAFGGSISLPEGKYLFRTRFGGKAFEKSLWINTGRRTLVEFNAANAEERQ